MLKNDKRVSTEIVVSLLEVTTNNIKHFHTTFDEIASMTGGDYARLKLNGIELTYFCLALTSNLYIKFANDSDFKSTLDTLTDAVLYISRDLINEEIEKDYIVAHYQQRYKTYDEILNFYLYHIMHKPDKEKAERGREMLVDTTLYHFYGRDMRNDILFSSFIARPISTVISELINIINKEIREKYFRK